MVLLRTTRILLVALAAAALMSRDDRPPPHPSEGPSTGGCPDLPGDQGHVWGHNPDGPGQKCILCGAGG